MLVVLHVMTDQFFLLLTSVGDVADVDGGHHLGAVDGDGRRRLQSVVHPADAAEELQHVQRRSHWFLRLQQSQHKASDSCKVN